MPRPKNLIPKMRTAQDLVKFLQDLKHRREQALQQVHEIDQVFASLQTLDLTDHQHQTRTNAKPQARTRTTRGDKAKAYRVKKKRAFSKAQARNTPGSNRTTGREFVLTFLKRSGPANTKAITGAWRKARRSARPDQAIKTLVDSGLVAKKNDPETKGSLYTLAEKK